MNYKFNNYLNTKFFLIIFRLISFFFFKKKDFNCIGLEHGKYYIPKEFFKKNNKNLWILSAGVGDNITFDEELLSLGYKIIFVDPTPNAIKYFDKYFDKKKFKNSFVFYKKALWNNEDKIKFFSSDSDKIISNSIANANNSKNFIEVPCITLDKIQKNLNFDNYSLIKIDIEGAELNVIRDLIKKKISTEVLLIEFDFLKQKNLISVLLELSKIFLEIKKTPYKLKYIDDLNFTFINDEKK